MSDNAKREHDSIPVAHARNFSILSYAMGFHVWLYKTAEELLPAQLSAIAFLHPYPDLFRRGDMMYVVTPRSTSMFRVSSGPKGIYLQPLARVVEDDGLSIPPRPAA